MDAPSEGIHPVAQEGTTPAGTVAFPAKAQVSEVAVGRGVIDHGSRSLVEIPVGHKRIFRRRIPHANLHDIVGVVAFVILDLKAEGIETHNEREGCRGIQLIFRAVKIDCTGTVILDPFMGHGSQRRVKVGYGTRQGNGGFGEPHHAVGSGKDLGRPAVGGSFQKLDFGELEHVGRCATEGIRGDDELVVVIKGGVDKTNRSGGLGISGPGGGLFEINNLARCDQCPRAVNRGVGAIEPPGDRVATRRIIRRGESQPANASLGS